MVIYCNPGEKLPDSIIEQLGIANANRRKNDFLWYIRQLTDIFQIEEYNTVTEEEKLFFGGFITGEGSINVSAKKDNGAKFGIVIDPEFSITQHINGVSLLFLAFRSFKTGSLRYKSGSNATLVYRIDNRDSLNEKVIPFYEKYCSPFWSSAFQDRLVTFKELLQLFQEKAHLNLSDFSEKVLVLWDKMRKQRTQINASFSSLEEAQTYAKNYRKLP
uniref:Putative LAGLIDADG homing endonuclease n=1 Tax=Symbiochloris reticulata TaxID=40981 RepID=A0A1B0RYA3_9CHLO|nr:putative LAGLIDADG homing endonuclease [Symbiochloris reticulata]